MPSITNFREKRRDGRIIDESMTVDKLLQLGWPVDKIAAVSWDLDGKTIEIRSQHGILAKLLPARDGVALLESLDEKGLVGSLTVVNVDGTRRFAVPNVQPVRGRSERGRFRWFEPARVTSPPCFGVIFELDRDHSQYQLDLDVATGSAAAAYPLR
jgi:hypothetical protein